MTVLKTSVAGGRIPDRVIRHTVGGVVDVRLVDPAPADVLAVERVLGPATASHPADTVDAGSPDLVIRFVDEVMDGGDGTGLRLVEGGRTAYADGGFYLLPSPAGDPVARLRLHDDEGASELICRRGRSVPLLGELVDLAALGRGWVPLHASAWTHEGRGVLAAGWDRSGKTGTLLAFGEEGADFVGDDRIFLARDGRTMFGLAAPFRVRGWHVAELPGLASRVGPARRLLGGVGRHLAAAEARLPSAGSGGGLAGRSARRVVERLRRGISVDVCPSSVFGADRCPGAATPDVVFLLLTHRKETVEVEPTDPGDLAGRLAAATAAELAPLRRIQLAARFAFPDHRWELLERAESHAADLLAEALAGKPAYEVRHPYPCSLSRMYREMRPVVARERGAGPRAEEPGARAGGAGARAGEPGPRAAEPGSRPE